MMKTIWFKKVGWVYIPVSIVGFLITIAVGYFCFTVFRAIDGQSHSNSDTLYGIFPFFVSAFTLLFWIASNTSGRDRK